MNEYGKRLLTSTGGKAVFACFGSKNQRTRILLEKTDGACPCICLSSIPRNVLIVRINDVEVTRAIISPHMCLPRERENSLERWNLRPVLQKFLQGWGRKFSLEVWILYQDLYQVIKFFPFFFFLFSGSRKERINSMDWKKFEKFLEIWIFENWKHWKIRKVKRKFLEIKMFVWEWIRRKCEKC